MRQPAIILAGAMLLLAVGSGRACDLIKDPLPSWEQMIDEAEVVFVGKVMATDPETEAGWGRARFDVETWIKGGTGPHFDAGQGSGGNCVLEFSVGARVIFAGSALGSTVLAEDTGWDPTVFLDDPPTAEQLVQLNYVNKLAQEQAAKGASK